MSTSLPVTQSGPPTIPTGRELYDAIMKHIEPELTTENAKLMDEKYKGETPAQHTERMKRYDLAFERYEEAYTQYMATLNTQVNRYRQETFARTEHEDRAAHEDVLVQKFDAMFQQAA